MQMVKEFDEFLHSVLFFSVNGEVAHTGSHRIQDHRDGNAFKIMTPENRGRLSNLRKRVAAVIDGTEDLANLSAEVERLETEVSVYRHAFETTAADRDRQAEELSEFRQRREAPRGQPANIEPPPVQILPPVNLAIQHRLSRQLQMVQRADHYFFVDVVGTCNLSCPSCAVGNSPPQLAKGLMSPAVFNEVLATLQREYSLFPRKFIDLYNWGEPGLHPHLAKLIKAAKDHGFGVGISSNLNVFPDLRDAIKAGPDYLRISVSGMRNSNYQTTHRGGNIHAVKANMYHVREFIDRYKSQTIVQMGFHVYRTNFPEDFLEARRLCDELGFIFAPTIATVMPAEKVVAAAGGQIGQFEPHLSERLVLPIERTLQILESSGPVTQDCQFRQARTTINFDASVSLCCATFNKDKIIEGDFRSVTPKDLTRKKYSHPFCGDCIKAHVNKLYTGIGASELNAEAAEVLGPLYEEFLALQNQIGNPDCVVIGNSFCDKTATYLRGIDALSRGQDGWFEAEECFDALADGAPDFAEGYFQAGALARLQGNLKKAREMATNALNLLPSNQAYQALVKDLQTEVP
jgi:tetratricopeptide (TPR) repeat protein